MGSVAAPPKGFDLGICAWIRCQTSLISCRRLYTGQVGMGEDHAAFLKVHALRVSR